MIKQIDLVGSDLRGQAQHYLRGRGNPISVGIVGINNAAQYTSYEGDRAYPTDGQKEKHPFHEAQGAMVRLKKEAEQAFTHFLFPHFRATNAELYPFEWVDHAGTVADYGAMLVRVSANTTAGSRRPAATPMLQRLISQYPYPAADLAPTPRSASAPWSQRAPCSAALWSPLWLATPNW
jgi:hypothetical protein